MPQEKSWEKEYQNPLFVTKKAEPQSDTLKFFKFFKKYTGKELDGLRILDLGCGTGRNSNYLAKLGNEVVGLEVSQTAIELAQKRAKQLEINVIYKKQSIGEKYDFSDAYFDMILDVTSSNALNEKEREVYLPECARTLKKDGLFFVRALCKDGDKNAKKLLQSYPGKEYDTYVMPKSGLVERVFSETDFRALYGKFFKIVSLSKKTGYTRFEGQSFKRNYWLACLQLK